MSDELHKIRAPFQSLVDDQARRLGEAHSTARSVRDLMEDWPAMKTEIDDVALPRLKTTLDTVRRATRAVRRKEPHAKKLSMLGKEIRRADGLGNVVFLHPSILYGWLQICFGAITIQRKKIGLWMDERRGALRGFLFILLLFSIPVVILLFFV